MLSLRIAARFLRTSPVQSGLIVAGIAVGIAVQVFVGSLISSLQDNLVQTVVGTSSQVTVIAQDQGDPVRLTDTLTATLEGNPRVTTIAAVRDFSALWVGSDDSAPLNVKSGAFEELDGIYELNRRLVSGEARLLQDDLLVGTEFSRKYSVAVGDEIKVALADGRDVRLKVVGVVDLGSAALNERQAFASPQLGRSALGLSEDKCTAIEMQIDDVFLSGEVARDLRSRLPEVRVVEWQSQNEDLLTALQSQSSSSYMIQAFVLLAVALGIASTLAISAVQKTKQIGILKAMGLRDRSAGLIFFWEAGILGIAGTAAGVLLGFLLLGAFAFVPLSFAIEPRASFVAVSASVGIAVAMLSAIIPTRRTSRLDPIEVIQGG